MLPLLKPLGANRLLPLPIGLRRDKLTDAITQSQRDNLAYICKVKDERKGAIIDWLSVAAVRKWRFSFGFLISLVVPVGWNRRRSFYF